MKLLQTNLIVNHAHNVSTELSPVKVLNLVLTLIECLPHNKYNLFDFKGK